jgi:hypothetical protein
MEIGARKGVARCRGRYFIILIDDKKPDPENVLHLLNKLMSKIKGLSKIVLL